MQLKILLLGPPEIRHEDRPVAIPRRLPRAMLYYLATQGMPVGREQLLLMFWGDLPEDNARRRLTDTLNKLRKNLPFPELISARSSLIGLDLERTYIDVYDFLSRMRAMGPTPWLIPPDEPLSEKWHRELAEAAGLWRMPTFLAGARLPSNPDLDRWLTQTGQQLELQHARVLERLAYHYFAIRSYLQAIQASSQALEFNENDENLTLLNIQALLALGRRSEAQARLEWYLENTPTPPSPRFIELQKQIAGDIPSPAISTPAWRLRPSLNIPFVGRKDTLQTIQRAYYHNQSLFIFGESGMGKTRLLQEASRALIPPPRILLSACKPSEINIPFRPISRLLQENVADEEWLGLSSEEASLLSLVVPGLASKRPDLQQPNLGLMEVANQEIVRASLFEAIRQMFALLARNQRLVWCFDDAQWSDEATLAAIGYLLDHSPFTKNAILLATGRSEESNERLETLLASLRGATQVRVIPLNHLGPDEIAQIATFVLGNPPKPDLLKRLAQDTGGNAYILLETLQAINEAGIPTILDGSESLPAAESVQELIQGRLQKVSRMERNLLEIAAILGDDFTPELLVETAGKPLAEIAACLEELEQRALIQGSSQRLGQIHYRFRHDMIKETIVSQLTPLRARILNEQVGRALEKTAGIEQAARIALHFERAGEYDKAFDYWVAAGQQARQLFSHSGATEMFGRAAGLIRSGTPLSDNQIHDLYTEWTEMAYEIEDVRTIQRLNNELLQLGRERQSNFLLGTALGGLSEACMASNQFTQGLAYAEQAIAHLETSENLYERMAAHNQRGNFLIMLGRSNEAIDALETALDLGAGSNKPQVVRARANAHYQLAVALTLGGWPDPGFRHGHQSRIDFISVDQTHGQITALSALTLSGYFLGKLQEALEASQEGIQLAHRLQAQRMLGYLHIYRGMVTFALGDIDATLEHAKVGVEIGQRHHHSEIHAIGERLLGDIYLWLEAYQPAITHYQRAVEASAEIFVSADSLFRLGLARCLHQDYASGAKLLDEALTKAQEVKLGITVMMTQYARIHVLSARGDWAAARTQAEELVEICRERKIAYTGLAAQLIQTEGLLHTGELAAGQSLLENAIAAAARQEYPWMEIRGRLLATRLPQDAVHRKENEARVQVILDRMQAQATQEPYRQAFENWRAKIESNLAAHSDG